MNSPSQFIDSDQRNWFAIRTKFRREKYLVNQLNTNGVEAYVPIQKLRRTYRSRVKNVEMPLIPNYAFVKISRKEYIDVLEAQGFISFVHFSGKIIPIPEREMEILKMVVAEEAILKCNTEEFTSGDWVEIKSGQLVGMCGQLIEEKGKRGFVVRLEQMGFSLTIDIEKHLLRKINAA